MYVARLFPPNVSRATGGWAAFLGHWWPRQAGVCVCVSDEDSGPIPSLGAALEPGPPAAIREGGSDSLHSCHFILHNYSPRGLEEPTRVGAFQHSVSAECMSSHQDEAPDKSWDGDGFLGKIWSSKCQRARCNRDELIQVVCLGNFLELWTWDDKMGQCCWGWASHMPAGGTPLTPCVLSHIHVHTCVHTVTHIPQTWRESC